MMGDSKCVKTFSAVQWPDWALHLLLFLEENPFRPTRRTRHICRSIRARTIRSQQVFVPNLARFCLPELNSVNTKAVNCCAPCTRSSSWLFTGFTYALRFRTLSALALSARTWTTALSSSYDARRIRPLIFENNSGNPLPLHPM